jgi:hypothetical protein
MFKEFLVYGFAGSFGIRHDPSWSHSLYWLVDKMVVVVFENQLLSWCGYALLAQLSSHLGRQCLVRSFKCPLLHFSTHLCSNASIVNLCVVRGFWWGGWGRWVQVFGGPFVICVWDLCLHGRPL